MVVLIDEREFRNRVLDEELLDSNFIDHVLKQLFCESNTMRT